MRICFWCNFFEGETFDVNKFKEFISGNADFRKAFSSFASNIEVDGDNLLTILNKSEKSWQKGSAKYNTIKSIMDMMMADDWDTSKGYTDIKEHLMTSGF